MTRRTIVPALLVCGGIAIGVGAGLTNGATASALLGVAAFVPIAGAVLPGRVDRKQSPGKRPRDAAPPEVRAPLQLVVAPTSPLISGCS
jgi:hypothetical protein